MKVTIDVSPAVHHRAGLGRYASELVNALSQVADKDTEVRAFYTESATADPQGAIARLPQFHSRLGYKPWRLAAMASHFLRLPFDRLYGSPDVVHATDHLLPHVRARSVFTLHDLIFEIYPEHHKVYNHTFLKMMMPRFLRAAAHIITVSEHTKRDAERLYGIDPARMTVISSEDSRPIPLPPPVMRATFSLNRIPFSLERSARFSRNSVGVPNP